MPFPKRPTGTEQTERWLVNAEDVHVGDILLVDWMQGTTLEKVSRSEPADGRHHDCTGHWLLAFEGKEQVGHCYTIGKAEFRRVV